MQKAISSRVALRAGADSIGWGILGTGARARDVVTDAIRQQASTGTDDAGAWVVGVYSHSEQRARTFAESHHLPHAFLNLADLLQRHEIHCVYIASHPRHHYALTMAALSAGKHVLVEPPLALSVAQAEALGQAADDRGLQLVVNHKLRAEMAIDLTRRLLADGVIGDLLGCTIHNTASLPLQQQSWRLQTNGGGVLLQRTYHSLDLLCYLLQDSVKSLYTTGSQRILGDSVAEPVEEDVHTLVTLQRHSFTAQLHDSFLIPHLPTRFELQGSQGALQIQHWADSTEPSQLWLVRNHLSERLRVQTHNADQRVIMAFQQSIHPQPRQNQAGTQRPPYLTTASSAIQGLAMVEAARQSLWHQRPFSVNRV